MYFREFYVILGNFRVYGFFRVFKGILRDYWEF